MQNSKVRIYITLWNAAISPNKWSSQSAPAYRTAKYFIFWQPDAVRYLWYLFYLPMLFVPMLALLIAMSLGKPDEYKFPKGMSILWIISGTNSMGR